MEPGGDVRAPGGAITVALCGHWEHEPPCPLAPHSTGAQRSGDQVRLRVLFATEPSAEAEVRGRIEAALSQDGLAGPDGITTPLAPAQRTARPAAHRRGPARRAAQPALKPGQPRTAIAVLTT